MNIKQLNLITKQVEIILDESKNLRGKNLKLYKENHVEYLYYLRTIDELIKQLNRITPKINELFKKEEIDYEIPEFNLFEATIEKIREESILFDAEPKLLKLIFASSNILSFIRQDIVLPENAQNKLDSLTDEISSLKEKLPEEVYSNLIDAKETFEKSCFLGSSLISGKLIRSCLDKMPGNDINEKIESLKNCNLVRDKEGAPSLIKASLYGRNLASHDLSIMPTASETISFLVEAVKIAKMTTEYLDYTSSKDIKN
ncbi:hypothetical protein HYV85_01585 [Candidatus Woesearchaeota archaeon]|nr:hypothetical protein [Candidatus Woesearchaeota archaeon]